METFSVRRQWVVAYPYDWNGPVFIWRNVIVVSLSEAQGSVALPAGNLPI